MPSLVAGRETLTWWPKRDERLGEIADVVLSTTRHVAHVAKGGSRCASGIVCPLLASTCPAAAEPRPRSSPRRLIAYPATFSSSRRRREADAARTYVPGGPQPCRCPTNGSVAAVLVRVILATRVQGWLSAGRFDVLPCTSRSSRAVDARRALRARPWCRPLPHRHDPLARARRPAQGVLQLVAGEDHRADAVSDWRQGPGRHLGGRRGDSQRGAGSEVPRRRAWRWPGPGGALASSAASRTAEGFQVPCQRSSVAESRPGLRLLVPAGDADDVVSNVGLAGTG